MIESPPKSHRRVVGLIAATALILIGWLIWSVYRSYRLLMAGDVNYARVLCTIDVVQQFVDDTHRWPRSWDELDPLIRSHGYHETSAAIRQTVAIDFQVKLEDLAQQDASDFSAIRHHGPIHGPYDAQLAVLLEGIRAVVEAENEVRE